MATAALSPIQVITLHGTHAVVKPRTAVEQRIVSALAQSGPEGTSQYDFADTIGMNILLQANAALHRSKAVWNAHDLIAFGLRNRFYVAGETALLSPQFQFGNVPRAYPYATAFVAQSAHHYMGLAALSQAPEHCLPADDFFTACETSALAVTLDQKDKPHIFKNRLDLVSRINRRAETVGFRIIMDRTAGTCYAEASGPC